MADWSKQIARGIECDKDGFRKYAIAPMGKPRMTQRDKWSKRPVVMRYWKFKEACKQAGIHVSESVEIRFSIPMPKSWSKKKKAVMDGQPHKTTPDIDNLEKALFDAVLDDDSGIWKTAAEKRWAYEGAIEIR